MIVIRTTARHSVAQASRPRGERRRHLFGLSAVIAPFIGESAAAVAGPALGFGAAGAGISALTGGKPLAGALTGGLTGGLLGAGTGGALSQYLGISPAAAAALIGAGSGALSGAVTGSNPITQALLGGAGGYFGSSQIVDPTGSSIVANDATNNEFARRGLSSAADKSVAIAAGGASAPVSQAAANATGTGLFGGPSGGISKAALALGALAALGQATSKPQVGTWSTPGPSSNAANLGSTFNQTLNTNVPGRMASNPWANTATLGASQPGQTSPYWAYGGAPQNYFSNNSLKSYGFAKGGVLRERSTDQGDHYVQGPGGPEEDLIPARLSPGEYILDHKDVTRIGGGSNARGAKILDRTRKQLDRGSGPLSRMAAEVA
jgi:hypothetical protein